MRTPLTIFQRTVLLATFPGVVLSGFAGTTNDVEVRPPTWAVKLNRPGLDNFHQITTNLYRGAQPTARGMAELKAMGIKTVVNLRTLHSDKDELVGVDLKQGRLHMKPWHAEEEDVVRFLRIIADTNNLPVFVHCQRGADRTGMLCAMYRMTMCDWTREEAIREMRAGGFNFYPGWKSIVTYVETADVDRLKKKLGLAPSVAAKGKKK